MEVFKENFVGACDSHFADTGVPIFFEKPLKMFSNSILFHIPISSISLDEVNRCLRINDGVLIRVAKRFNVLLVYWLDELVLMFMGTQEEVDTLLIENIVPVVVNRGEIVAFAAEAVNSLMAESHNPGNVLPVQIRLLQICNHPIPHGSLH